MIRIIKGTYGYLTELGTVKPWTEKDGPLTLTEEQEARLVGLGVAEYVAKAAEVEAEPEGGEKLLEEMTAKELREVGKEYGLTLKVGMTKAEMIEEIKAAEAEDDEDVPSFDAAEAVE